MNALSSAKPALYIMIGGFLGAGKTTSVIQLAAHLEKQGHRIGVITNDQAEDLVDTQLVRRSGFNVKEIAGGCFCCRFSSLKEAAEQLTLDNRPDVFIAEPVGSCTDLIATVSYPLRRLYGEDYHIAPLSVLLDPQRALRILGLVEGKRFSAKIEYIYLKQIEEAQLLVVNKVDALDSEQKLILEQALHSRFSDKPIYWISAKTGVGLESWFDAITTLNQPLLSQRSLEIDYQEYAQGEALLGWLNATLLFESLEEMDGNAFLSELCRSLSESISHEQGLIAHIKLTFKPSDDDYEMASVQLVGNDYIAELGLTLCDEIDAGEIIVNARAEMGPEALMRSLQTCLKEMNKGGVTLTLVHADHFAPAEPVPEYRMEVGRA